MKREGLIAATGLLLAGAYWFMKQNQGGTASADNTTSEAEDVLNSTAQTTAQFLDGATGGYLKISAMARVSPTLLQNKNVQAMLRVIRTGEGTADAGGYSRLFGGGNFTGFADHPRQKITKWGLTSTAAGAYQFLASSWDETKRTMGLVDFSPASQDLAALGRLAARGALDDVVAGRFTSAIKKINREWASMPGSPYGQRTMQFSSALAIYQGTGGLQVETTAIA
jgi:muramidase (phage lysozyme)